MPFYLVTRTDDPNYDEYDSVVVRANSEEEVRDHILWPFRDSYLLGFTEENITVTRLAETEGPAVILASFNAG